MRIPAHTKKVGKTKVKVRSHIRKITRDMPKGVDVNCPCDIHLIEAYARGMPEVVHCAEWDNVDKIERNGVRVMRCPQPGCCPDEESIEAKCCLDYEGT